MGITDKWLVAFVPAENHGIWRLGRGKFGHCFALRFAGPCWLLTEYNVWGLTVKAVDDERALSLISYTLHCGHLLLSLSRPRPFRWLPPPALTCVTAMCALLGIRAWIWTPRQLHAALIARGAAVLSGPLEDTDGIL